MYKLAIFAISFFLWVSSACALIDPDGSVDYISWGDIATLDFGSSTDFTVSARINTEVGTRHDICGKGDAIDSGDKKHWELVIGDTGTGQFGFFIDDGTNTKSNTADGADITDSAWHHVLITFDRSGNATRYVDGVAYGSVTAISTVGNISSSQTFSIARRGNKDANEFNGKIEELAVWNTLLSAQDIANLAFSKIRGMPSQISPGNLVFYAPLDEFTSGEITQTWRDFAGGNTAAGTDADSSSSVGPTEELSYQP